MIMTLIIVIMIIITITIIMIIAKTINKDQNHNNDDESREPLNKPNKLIDKKYIYAPPKKTSPAVKF